VASPAAPAPAPTAPAPSQGGSSTPQPQQGGGGSEQQPFDARADAAELWDGPDSNEQDRGSELAEEALADDQAPPDEQLPGDEQGEDGPVTLGGLEFPSREALEQYVSTNAGRQRALMEGGQRWQDYATQLESRLAQLEQGHGAPMPERPQEQAPQQGLPSDFVDAYKQNFGPEWYARTEQAFIAAANAPDEQGVKQAFQQFASSMLGGVAQFLQSREQALRGEIDPVRQSMQEQQASQQAVQAHGAVIRQAASLRDPDSGALMFPHIFTEGPNGQPQFAGPQGKQMAEAVYRVMDQYGMEPTLQNFGMAYATAVGLMQLSSAPQPQARQAAGDPTLSGSGVSPIGTPRRAPQKPDPYGLPAEGPTRGRVMGIRFDR
jgi:hypothetical protein